MRLTDTIWHGWLRRPYRLHKALDRGSGPVVVFLHGLGRSSAVWRHMVELVASQPDDRPNGNDQPDARNIRKDQPDAQAASYPASQPVPMRIIAFDLLGFGASPKPGRIQYTIDDHARAVIAALSDLRPRRWERQSGRGDGRDGAQEGIKGKAQKKIPPVVLVGHSMGCLIAVRVARLRPDLVRHLILYEMPLYSGLPDKRRYRLRLNIYFSLYNRIVAYRPIFQEPGKKRAQRLAEKLAGFSFDDETWRPFVHSLKHTIMEQTTHEDIAHIQMPMDVIYGSRDRLVIRGKTQEIFGEDVLNIVAHTIRENHRISKKASKFILSRVNAALEATSEKV